MGQSTAGSHKVRNLLIGLCVLLVLYALAGFLLLPWWLEKELPNQLNDKMGWQAQVSDIRFNPFLFSLEADEFSAQDDEERPVAAFEHLYVNLDVLQLARGVVGFDGIRLVKPDVRLDLLEDYSVNFARDWKRAIPELAEDTTEAKAADSELPKLYFSHLAIEDGRLLFRDFTQKDTIELNIKPLSLAVDDLATWSRSEDESRYSIVAAIGDQTLEWEGELSINPLYSQGRVRFSDVSYKTLAKYLAPHLPWRLKTGRVTAESDYWFSNERGFQLETSNGKIEINQLALALAEDVEEPSLRLETVTVGGIGFDLAAKQAQVGMVTIEQPFVSATRQADGRIDWQASLPPVETAPEADGLTDAGQPFRWEVQGVELTEGRLRWRDEAAARPAELEWVDLAVTLGELSHRTDEPTAFELATQLASGGQISAKGQLTPTPFNFEAALAGSDIVLEAVEPYIQLGANVAISNGLLSFDGNLDLDGQAAPVTGTFSGSAQLTDFDLKLPEQQGELVTWQLLRLAPVEFNVNPARLEIGTVTLEQPYFNLVRLKGGAHNVEGVVKAGPDAQPRESSEENATSRQTDEQPEFIFRIGELLIEGGSVDYTDRTLSPVFTTGIERLSGSVSGISNVPPQQGLVSVQGELAGGAPVSFQGSLGALGTEETSDLKLTMEGVSLPALSPYLGRYLGYAVDAGKLDLELDYEITGTNLKASNQLRLDQMRLGQSVASEEAVNAPVKLGLALLENQQGIIDVDLPISGDISNPDFRIGQVVMRTFVNLLVKAAASPFSMLGSLADFAGFSTEELGRVSFVPGKIALADGEAEKIAALAKALNDRPDLLLSIRGAAEPEVDGLVLLKERMRAAGEAVSDEAWAQAKREYQAGERQLPPESIRQLAARRGQAIHRLLKDTHGVPDDQLFSLETLQQSELDEQGNVIVPFTLDVR
ncbi:DUF748 domain-containing protein [Marinobacter litoralis]|uniref:DUF748 domain-containing protein n=1 Tax=Marinobacter litoralis TaxID=187981 RepID=UPI0018ED3358|nr:DUF748 domain-containing protein [Marinobacter litoralis]MBJ6136228.1 DUF748 domain-containing protein [Marinobacter litoralis]